MALSRSHRLASPDRTSAGDRLRFANAGGAGAPVGLAPVQSKPLRGRGDSDGAGGTLAGQSTLDLQLRGRRLSVLASAPLSAGTRVEAMAGTGVAWNIRDPGVTECPS